MRFGCNDFGICETGLLSLMTLFLSLVDIESKPVGKCPLVDSKVTTIHLADSEDCSVYYTCHLGKAVERRCRSGLHFNPSIWNCDLPQKAGCFFRSPAAAVTKSACPAVGTCPAGSPPRNLPHAADCSMYCVCSHGALVTRRCPSGLWFNHDLDACDLPLYSDCQVPCPALGNCPHSSSTSFLAHRFDCSLYCKCLNGTPLTAACASGLWFSSRKGICVAPEDSGCVAETPESGGSKSNLPAAKSRSTSSILQQLATIRHSSNTVDTTTVPHESKYPTSNSDEWISRKASKAESTLYGPIVLDSMVSWKPILQSENFTSPYTNSAPRLVTNPSQAVGRPKNFPAPSQSGNDAINIVPLTPNDPSPTTATTRSFTLVSPNSSQSYIRDHQMQASTSSTVPRRTTWKNVSKSSVPFPKALSSKKESAVVENEIIRRIILEKQQRKFQRSKSTIYCDADGVCPQSNENSVAVVLPSRTSCEIFCMCEDGAPITMRCPRGRHFSASLKLCDDPSRAGCLRKSGCIPCRSYLHLYCGVSLLLFLVKISITS